MDESDTINFFTQDEKLENQKEIQKFINKGEKNKSNNSYNSKNYQNKSSYNNNNNNNNKTNNNNYKNYNNNINSGVVKNNKYFLENSMMNNERNIRNIEYNENIQTANYDESYDENNNLKNQSQTYNNEYNDQNEFQAYNNNYNDHDESNNDSYNNEVNVENNMSYINNRHNNEENYNNDESSVEINTKNPINRNNNDNNCNNKYNNNNNKNINYNINNNHNNNNNQGNYNQGNFKKVNHPSNNNKVKNIASEVKIENIFLINQHLQFPKEEKLWYIVDPSTNIIKGPFSSNTLAESYEGGLIHGQFQARLIDIFQLKNQSPFYYFKLHEINDNNFKNKIINSALTKYLIKFNNNNINNNNNKNKHTDLFKNNEQSVINPSQQAYDLQVPESILNDINNMEKEFFSERINEKKPQLSIKDEIEKDEWETIGKRKKTLNDDKSIYLKGVSINDNKNSNRIPESTSKKIIPRDELVDSLNPNSEKKKFGGKFKKQKARPKEVNIKVGFEDHSFDQTFFKVGS